VIRHVDELLHECRQLTSADAADNTTAAGAAAGAETRRYDTLMQRYCDNVTSIANLVAMTTESIQKRDSLNVSCCLFTDSLIMKLINTDLLVIIPDYIIVYMYLI